ncbi:MAG: uncharacterized protein A8A55_1646 [Amphiamblys sp. WSBS2006]|nr:MAG: uncharacterized protein A8A55_1646 [Amphiamblys sp. WSBS2006]
METRVARILKLGNTFFVFINRGVFLVPQSEYERIRQRDNGYVCLKRKNFSEETDRDTERVICIVCHEEAALEDFVAPLCRQMHFVLCRECIEYLKKRTNKKEVVCPYCKEKKSDKVYQEEIIGILFSLIPHQTLLFLELRPDMEAETVTRLPRETRVILSNVYVSDALFFQLLGRTAVEITNRVFLFRHYNSLDCCLEELDAGTDKPLSISVSTLARR